jgi:hypothetical protein
VSKSEPSDSEREERAQLLSERSVVEHQLGELAVTLSQREIATLSAVQSAIPANAALALWIDGSTVGIEEHWGCVVRTRNGATPSGFHLAGCSSRR